MSKVICPGESLIDFVCMDHDTNLIDGFNFVKKAGGAPANVAVAIKKMGATPFVISTVGDDQFGDFLIETLEKYKLDTSMMIKVPNSDTTLAFVSLTSDGERDFRFNRGADALLEMSMIPPNLLEEATVFHFGSATAFLEGPLNSTYFSMLDYAAKNNKIISFDPNFRDALFGGMEDLFIENCKKFIRFTDVLKVSDEEAALITGVKDVEGAARDLIELGAKNVLITLGSKGTLFVTKDSLEYIPVKKVEMVDATGAGDAFIGSVIADVALEQDLSIESMRRFILKGNLVGSITVQNIGALDSIPTLEEIEGLL